MRVDLIGLNGLALPQHSLLPFLRGLSSESLDRWTVSRGIIPY